MTRAIVTVDGVRLIIQLESTLVSAATPVWVTTTLENTGSNMLRWITDGCGTHVGVRAKTALQWAYGAIQPEPFKTFKDWILGRYRGEELQPIYLTVTPEPFVAFEDYGCADLAVPHALEPGGRITARHLLNGDTEGYGLAPSGPVELAAQFDFWFRGKPDSYERFRDPVVVRLGVDLEDGRDPALLSAGQAIDVVLQASEIQRLLLRNPAIPDFNPTSLDFDTATERWWIGISGLDLGRRKHQVTLIVDATSAAIVDIRDSP